MNKSQKIILLVYCGIIVAILIYPPFNILTNGDGGYLVQSEYSLIWEPIKYDYISTSPLGVIDTPRILAQMLGATLIAGTLVLIFKSKKI